MLQKKYRLTAVSISNPKNFKSLFFNLKIGENSLGVSRFAFVVSKKIDPRATERNMLRRKVRSCIEEIFDSIRQGNDFIFYPKQEAIRITRGQFLEEVKSFLTREKLLK